MGRKNYNCVLSGMTFRLQCFLGMQSLQLRGITVPWCSIRDEEGCLTVRGPLGAFSPVWWCEGSEEVLLILRDWHPLITYKWEITRQTNPSSISVHFWLQHLRVHHSDLVSSQLKGLTLDSEKPTIAVSIRPLQLPLRRQARKRRRKWSCWLVKESA